MDGWIWGNWIRSGMKGKPIQMILTCHNASNITHNWWSHLDQCSATTTKKKAEERLQYFQFPFKTAFIIILTLNYLGTVAFCQLIQKEMKPILLMRQAVMHSGPLITHSDHRVCAIKGQ